MRTILLFAAVLCVGTLKAQTKTASGYYDSGHENMLQKEDYKAAIADYTKCIELSKDKVEIAAAYNCRGNCYKSLKEFDKAMADYNSSLGVAPNWMPHHNIAMIYLDRKEYVKAMDELNKATELEPKKAAIAQSKAEVYLEMGDKENACNSWNRAVFLGLARESEVKFKEICK